MNVDHVGLGCCGLQHLSPGAEGPIFQDPPSPDYVPGPEEPEQAPPSPIYIPFVPEPVYPEFLPVDDEVFPAEEQPMPAAVSRYYMSQGYIQSPILRRTQREDDGGWILRRILPTIYADRGDRDDEESICPYLAYRVTARMSIRPQAPIPFLSEEVAKRLLALPTPPPSPISHTHSPLH
ncbi:hypothetical protein Tco_0668987 [Tanacetum coccineum]